MMSGILHFALDVIVAATGHDWIIGSYCSSPSVILYPLAGEAF